MTLALKALRYMMWLAAVGLLLALIAALLGHPAAGNSVIFGTLELLLLFLVGLGLRAEVRWVAWVFFIYCIWLLISGIIQPITYLAVIGYLQAVLAFVGISGIWQWSRNRAKTA